MGQLTKGGNTMSVLNALRLAVAVLTSAFGIQLAISTYNKPDPHYVASWKHSPNNIQEAKKLAKHAITGSVVKLERGNDLVVKAPSEPGGVDRIPIEVVTIRVEETHKGGPGQEIKIFRTGSPDDFGLASRPAPTTPAPPKPPGGIDKPAQMPQVPEFQDRRVLLEDDPPYRPGERVYLLLEDGPQVAVAGAPVNTLRPVSPEGRYTVTADKKIHPVSKKAFAQQMRGMPEDQFKGLLKQ